MYLLYAPTPLPSLHRHPASSTRQRPRKRGARLFFFWIARNKPGNDEVRCAVCICSMQPTPLPSLHRHPCQLHPSASKQVGHQTLFFLDCPEQAGQ